MSDKGGEKGIKVTLAAKKKSYLVKTKSIKKQHKLSPLNMHLTFLTLVSIKTHFDKEYIKQWTMWWHGIEHYKSQLGTH